MSSRPGNVDVRGSLARGVCCKRKKNMSQKLENVEVKGEVFFSSQQWKMLRRIF